MWDSKLNKSKCELIKIHSDHLLINGKAHTWSVSSLLTFKGVVLRLVMFFTGDPDVILRCIVAGFFANAARIHHSGSYR